MRAEAGRPGPRARAPEAATAEVEPASPALAGFPLLARLTHDQRRALESRLERLDVAEGVTLFGEGDPADALWLLVEGRVALSSGPEPMGSCGPGTALGPLSLVVDGPRQATARTQSRCRILRLHRDGYAALRSAAPEAACRLLEGIVCESAALVREALGHLVDPPPASE